MAHWYVTCHGNAVNLDQARQVFVKHGRDGLFRVCAEFLVAADTGETVIYSLESGLETEDVATIVMRRILGAPDAGEPPVEIRQAAPARPQRASR